MKTPDLKSCPFCGSTKLKIDKKSKLVGHNGLDDRVEQHTFSVRCNMCHARGGAVGGKVLSRIRREFDTPSWATTDEELKNRAIEAWNSRAGGKLICQITIPTADHLLANGVTVQQWIPVTERLPEDDENLRFYDDGQLRFTSVLVHDENRGTAIANRLMIRHHSIPIFDELATDGWVWSRPYEPTHWMPLPEPPKEECP